MSLHAARDLRTHKAFRVSQDDFEQLVHRYCHEAKYMPAQAIDQIMTKPSFYDRKVSIRTQEEMTARLAMRIGRVMAGGQAITAEGSSKTRGESSGPDRLPSSYGSSGGESRPMTTGDLGVIPASEMGTEGATSMNPGGKTAGVIRESVAMPTAPEMASKIGPQSPTCSESNASPAASLPIPLECPICFDNAKGCNHVPAAQLPIPSAVIPNAFEWAEPVRHGDGSGFQLSIGGKFSITKNRVNGKFVYVAWARLPTPVALGKAGSSAEARALCGE